MIGMAVLESWVGRRLVSAVPGIGRVFAWHELECSRLLACWKDAWQ